MNGLFKRFLFIYLLLLLFKRILLFLTLLTHIFLGRLLSCLILVLPELEIFVAFHLFVEIIEHFFFFISILVRLLSNILLFQLDLDLIRSWQLFLTLNCLDPILFQKPFLCDYNLPHISYHAFLDLQIYLQLDILELENMIFNYNLCIYTIVPNVSLFSFDLILRIMSYLIFLVAAMLYIICKFVISFFNMFLFVLSLSV